MEAEAYSPKTRNEEPRKSCVPCWVTLRGLLFLFRCPFLLHYLSHSEIAPIKGEGVGGTGNLGLIDANIAFGMDK